MKVLIAYEPGVHFTLGASFAQAHRLSRPSEKACQNLRFWADKPTERTQKALKRSSNCLQHIPKLTLKRMSAVNLVAYDKFAPELKCILHAIWS